MAGVALIVGAMPAEAARHVQRQAYSDAAPAAVPISEWIVLDANTGQTLSESNADAVTYPASLTKMMTLYLTFEALNAGRLRLDQMLYVSENAANKRPSKLGLRAGDSVAVQDLILGIVTKSANDAAATLAEGLGGGSEVAFAEHMTRKARELGMSRTYYHNASGLPDPEQRTTARDIARLALALYHDFPREYRYFSTREFNFRGETVMGHDHLLEWYQGADGIKTGFINASGFNLATSAVRDGHRLIGVVMGGRTARSRDREMASLLDDGFVRVAGEPIAVARRDVPQQLPQTQPQPVGASRPVVPASVPAPSRGEDPIGALAQAAAASPSAATPARMPSPGPIPATVSAGAGSSTMPAAGALGPERPGLLGKALQHLSPVAKAEAAPMAHEPPLAREIHQAVAGPAGWIVQLGAFRAEKAAKSAVKAASAVPAARGKPIEIVAPEKEARERLYRARLLDFESSKAAQETCDALHRKKLECKVVHGGSVHFAAR